MPNLIARLRATIRVVELFYYQEANVSKFKQLLSSRKFWAAFVGLVMVIVGHFVPDFPIPEEQIQALAWVIVSYILGTALEDGLRGQG